MELDAKAVNGLRPICVVTETFVFDVWLGSEWASRICEEAV